MPHPREEVEPGRREDAAGDGADSAAIPDSADLPDSAPAAESGSAAETEPGSVAEAEPGSAAEAEPGSAYDSALAAAPASERAADSHEESAPRPPLLASEALMEDLAPVEPARGAARLWCAAIGLTFVLLGGLSVAGLRPGGYGAGASSFALGAVAMVAALTRVSYRQRAVAMVAAGVLSTVLGLFGSGPALGIDVGGGASWGAARALAAAALPAALAFRARYRAYAGARWLLGAAFAATLPFLAHAIFRVASRELGLEHVGDISVIIAVAASLLGFMGSETTGAGAYLAGAVVLALTADLALAGFAAQGGLTLRGAIAVATTALAFAATSSITFIGLFQILAWRLAADARRINLHPPPPKEPPRPASSGDWLT